MMEEPRPTSSFNKSFPGRTQSKQTSRRDEQREDEPLQPPLDAHVPPGAAEQPHKVPEKF